MQSHRLFPERYYSEIALIFEKLPEKHAEKQAEVMQHELSLRLLSGTPYLPFYRVFMKLNETYGPQGDYATKYLDDPNYLRCRYPTIFTRIPKKSFRGLNIHSKEFKHIPDFIPGYISEGNYPAAAIQLQEGNEDKFIVLGEGPYPHTFSVLLDRLTEQKINVLVAVGPPDEGGKEKYFNYMKLAKEISAVEYLSCTTDHKEIPDEFKYLTHLTIKFYQYIHPENNNIFYIMHIPSWKDLGMPFFTETDKHILAYDAEYGGNKFYHCSAGVGRSVAVIMMRMVYESICKPNLNLEQAVQQFESILKRIKDVKPRAGEWWQLLLAIGLAEDMHEYMVEKLRVEVSQTKEQKCHAVLVGSMFKKPSSSTDRNPLSSELQDHNVAMARL